MASAVNNREIPSEQQHAELGEQPRVSVEHDGSKENCSTRPGLTITHLPSFIRPSYMRLKRRKTQSRFYGWKWGILTGVVAAASVLMLNLTFMAIGLSKTHDEGIATLLSGDKDSINRANIALHLLINICSTLLMGASNYAMQVLTAPTRASCDRAHQARESLDIGIMSISNLRMVSFKRRWLWIGLLLSSVPLHLFYNASVFQVARLFDKYAVMVDEQSSGWSNATASLSAGSARELNLTKFWMPSITDKLLHVTFCVDDVKIGYFNTSKSPKAVNHTDNRDLKDLLLPHTMLFPYIPSWFLSPGSDGWLRLPTFQTRKIRVLLQGRDDNAFLKIHIQRTIVRTQPDSSKILLSLPLISIVAFSNAVKLAILVFISLDSSGEPPLVTIGDTISSFLTYPDPNTSTYRNFTLDDFLYETGDAKLREKIDAQKILRGDQSVAGQWQSRVRQYGLIVNRRSTSHNHGLAYLRLSACLLPGAATLIIAIPPGPWGAASRRLFEFPGGVAGSGYIALALFVNAPQLLLSMLYFTLNRICTSIATVREYNQFGIRNKALRVSKPGGKQREKYFLQLPLRFAIPLNSTSGILQWLTSQTLFLVRLDVMQDANTINKEESSAAWGVSGSAYLTTITVLWLLLIAILSIAGSKSTERVPFAGTSSWVMSAACHPPASDKEPALQEVCWGRVADEAEAVEGQEQFSFASSAVVICPEGLQARSHGRIAAMIDNLRHWVW